jgi:hypothetical protein
LEREGDALKIEFVEPRSVEGGTISMGSIHIIVVEDR